MRGPGYKLSGDVRRTWRCPKCGRERKLQGEITTLLCSCHDGTWMQIVAERAMVPRPLQRPSDVERRPSDFGIEAPPPLPARPEATIIKPAVSREPDSAVEISHVPDSALPPSETTESPSGRWNQTPDPVEDEWGEGIF